MVFEHLITPNKGDLARCSILLCICQGTARDRVLGNQGWTQMSRSTVMSQVQSRARKPVAGWSPAWWGPWPGRAELWQLEAVPAVSSLGQELTALVG